MNYKGSYLEQLTIELTSLLIEYVDYDRWGEPEYSVEMKPLKLIRAPKYSSQENSEAGDYDGYISGISQHALNEVTILSNEVASRMLKRFEQLDNHIDKAWKVYFRHWGLFSEGKFSALQFQWDFFHFFNIPIIERVGIMDNPHFPMGHTTDSFFWDIHDAMMYKQGGVKLICSQLRIQLDLPTRTDSTEPIGDEGLNSQPPQKNPPISIMQLAMINFYLKSGLSDDAILALLSKYSHKSVDGYKNELSKWSQRKRRISKVDNKRTYTTITGNYKVVFEYFNSLADTISALKVEKDFLEFNLNNIIHEEE